MTRAAKTESGALTCDMPTDRSQHEFNRLQTWMDPALEPTEFLAAEFQNFLFPPHLHEAYAIGIIEEGGQRFRPGRGDPLVMPAGTLCVINPGVVHEGRPATDQGWRYRMFYPTPSLVARALGGPSGNVSPMSCLPRFAANVLVDAGLFNEFRALHRASGQQGALLERESRILIFLQRLFARHAAPGRKVEHAAGPRTAALARDFLHAHCQQRVRLADLAAAAGVSETQVIRSFSRETGMPPHAYLVALRVERAKRLIRAGRPLAGAALEAGFADQSHLNRHFRRLTGTTPGRFASDVEKPHLR